MAITFKSETTMMAAANEKAFVVHRDGELIGWAYSSANGWRCVSNGGRRGGPKTYWWTTQDQVSAWLDKMKP